MYSKYRNTLTGLIKSANKHYLTTKCHQQKNNIKGTWNLIKTISPYFVNGDRIYDDTVIANAFNDYFVNIGNTI